MDQKDFDIANVSYVEELYAQWKQGAVSPPAEWQELFEAVENGHVELDTTLLGFSTEPKVQAKADSGLADIQATTQEPANGRDNSAEIVSYLQKQRAVDKMLVAYRDIGVLHADINPLEQYEPPKMRFMRISAQGVGESLAKEHFGLSDADLDSKFEIGHYFEPKQRKLSEIIDVLDKTYCSTTGYEFMHIKNQSMRNWLLKHIESPHYFGEWEPRQKIRFQKDLIKSEEFEEFVQKNFVGQKRFSLEGGNVFIPALHYLLYSSIDYGIRCMILGMSHRGRLNTFTNALRKPASETFIEFLGNLSPNQYGGMGDVKYHLGHSLDYVSKGRGTVHVSLCPNPSHLEAVDPVVQGKARGMQRIKGDWNRKKVLPVLVHGDAAFAGQGIVAETFNLSQIPGYRTGGTVHIIINNQIGFTTPASGGRSSYFASSIARMLQVPIFHVNGNDPEAVMRAMGLALAWRQKFGYDAVIDIICYRKRGHNEADEPSFTHPRMYNIIKQMKSPSTIYGEILAQSGVYPLEKQKEFRGQYADILKKELKKAQDQDYIELPAARSFRGLWDTFSGRYTFDPIDTSVSKESLERVKNSLVTVPEGFNIHPKLERIMNERNESFSTKIDWSFAEALGLASMLMEGYSVRLSGEDTGRGTFSQRHAEWWDFLSDAPKSYVPLMHLGKDQGVFSIYNSPLSEFSVLGFEYGYSLTQPNCLIIWEAQFGDFVNGAQVIIDQFIVSGESKWYRSSGLVLLLPHGYEGQGPEHSSAHLARFLQFCAGDNIQVINLTTPAQYFHMLRRQVKQKCRKPLIVMSPKSILRNPEARSPISALTKGSFQFVINESDVPKPETVLFCSGKVYYDLLATQKRLEDSSTAIIRIEQLYPWPEDAVRKSIEGYSPKRWVWVQEEAQNFGAWVFVKDRLEEIVSGTVHYVGRPATASPASGSYKQYQMELEALLRDAFVKPSAQRGASKSGQQSSTKSASSSGKKSKNTNKRLPKR